MPGRRQPKSLEGLSLGRVCEQIDGTCRYLQMLSERSSAVQALALAKQTFRPYYRNALPVRLRSQIIEETSKMLCLPLPGRSLSEPALLYLLVLLLSHDIKQLKVYLCCYYGCSHQTSLLKLLASEGIGLKSLHLSRPALLRLDCKLLRSALLNMRNLSILALRNIADDAILQVIGRTCSRLVVLDIACSRHVTDAGLKNLLLHTELRSKVYPTSRCQERTSWSRFKRLLAVCKINSSKLNRRIELKSEKQNILLEYYESKNPLCGTLRVLNVANTAVTSAGVLLALLHVPQLESLAEYSYLGRVVEIMNEERIVPKTLLNLTEVVSCRATPIQLKLLAQTCPRVEKLRMFKPCHLPQALRFFPHIVSLNVHDIPEEREWLNGLHDYLRLNGHSLRELNIQMARRGGTPLQVDLKEILSSCPNLQILINDGSNIIWIEGDDPPPLRYLRKIQLGRNANALAITKVLSLAPELTVLHVYNCFDLTHKHLEKVLKPPTKFISSAFRNSDRRDDILQNLTCFYIHEASQLSAGLSMFNNYKQLRQIGNLANWGLNYEDIITTFSRTNLEIDLCSGAHWVLNNCIQRQIAC